MPLKLVKLYVNDAPCDKAFARGDFDKFHCLCKKVNHERKLCQSRYFNIKVAKL